MSRTGDARDSVREGARHLLRQLMPGCVTPRQLLERLTPALAHRSARAREEMLLLLQEALSE